MHGTARPTARFFFWGVAPAVDRFSEAPGAWGSVAPLVETRGFFEKNTISV